MKAVQIACGNCFGSGTIFPRKTFKEKSKVCPECRGACRITVIVSKDSTAPLKALSWK